MKQGVHWDWGANPGGSLVFVPSSWSICCTSFAIKTVSRTSYLKSQHKTRSLNWKHLLIVHAGAKSAMAVAIVSCRLSCQSRQFFAKAILPLIPRESSNRYSVIVVTEASRSTMWPGCQGVRQFCEMPPMPLGVATWQPYRRLQRQRRRRRRRRRRNMCALSTDVIDLVRRHQTSAITEAEDILGTGNSVGLSSQFFRIGCAFVFGAGKMQDRIFGKISGHRSDQVVWQFGLVRWQRRCARQPCRLRRAGLVPRWGTVHPVAYVSAWEIFFKSITGLGTYAICDDLWLCSVEYSACVSGFWGIRPQTPSGALPVDPAGAGRFPSPGPPLLSPLANSSLRHCVHRFPVLVINQLFGSHLS